MKEIIISTLLCSIIHTVSAQQKKMYVVQPGEYIISVIPVADQYEYSMFQQGTVHFRNGKSTAAKLNYYFFSGEISFINKNNDTLILNNEPEVKKVQIGTDEYYFTKDCFVKKDTIIGDKILAVASFFEASAKRKTTTYGTETEGSIDAQGSFFDPKNGARANLIAQSMLYLKKRESIYIGDRFFNFVPATKKNILSLYSEKSKVLTGYLNTHKVNFVSKKDLAELITFMSRQ